MDHCWICKGSIYSWRIPSASAPQRGGSTARSEAASVAHELDRSLLGDSSTGT